MKLLPCLTSGLEESIFIPCLNRMNDNIENCWVTGTIQMDGQNIHDLSIDVVPLLANYSLVIVTPSMQQTARASQRTAYYHLGRFN